MIFKEKWKLSINFCFVLNSKRIKKRSNLLKYEFIVQVFLNTHNLVLLLQLNPGAENNLSTFIIHLTLIRDRLKTVWILKRFFNDSLTRYGNWDTEIAIEL